MLGDFQFGFGNVEHLALLDSIRLLSGQRAPAAFALRDAVGHGIVGLLYHAQRMSPVPFLAAGLALAPWSQAFRFGLVQAVGRRRFAAVAAVLGKLISETFHFLTERGELGLESVKLRGQFAEQMDRGRGIGLHQRPGMFAADHRHSSRRKWGLSGST